MSLRTHISGELYLSKAHCTQHTTRDEFAICGPDTQLNPTHSLARELALNSCEQLIGWGGQPARWASRRRSRGGVGIGVGSRGGGRGRVGG